MKSKMYVFYRSMLRDLGILLLVIVVLGVLLKPHGHYIRRGRDTQAISEIRNIELSITKMLSDAGTTTLREFFDDAAFGDAIARLGREQGLDAFDASVEIYSYEAYVLLRKGRDALDVPNDYGAVLRPEVVQRLGTRYFSELAFDPWGKLYRVFPGPWPEAMGPVVFRQYLPVAGSALTGNTMDLPDNLKISGIDPETGEDLEFGWPAPGDEMVYIWSYGANLLSGQPHYDPTHEYAPPAQQYYDPGQELELCGGGDDINNWDRDQTFMRFYN